MDRLVWADSFSQVTGMKSEWWRGAVIYQIYPRSFQDSNNDGIGDLQGIVQRLPYVAKLGVDAIWISPFFKSPMKDFGYDVADYRDVAPEFGTLDDFDTLLETAHRNDLKVIIDLAISHTSDQHAWFIESQSSRNNARSEWYVWADAKDAGEPPNNWLSVFGGPAWQWDSTRRQYYLHNFLPSQPDLNFHNPEVRKALLELAEFWLARGVDGFRLDTVNFYYCDKKLQSNPPLPQDQRNASIAPIVNPYNFQSHIYDKSQPENIEFIESLRQIVDRFPNRFTMGEVGDSQRGMEIVANYTQGNSRLHSCYSFDLLSGDTIDSDRIFSILTKFESNAAESWASWAVSNHDVIRHASRWNLDKSGLKLVAMLLMCLRGSICIYQGEELGLTEAELDEVDVRDPYGIEFWPKFKGRDGCRTPMVWEKSKKNAGFSETEPWLPIPDNHYEYSAIDQVRESDSLLNHYRHIIALRRSYPALQTGSIEQIKSENGIVSFKRCLGNDIVYCIFNVSDTKKTMHRPLGTWNIVAGNISTIDKNVDNIELSAWEFIIATKAQVTKCPN